MNGVRDELRFRDRQYQNLFDVILNIAASFGQCGTVRRPTTDDRRPTTDDRRPTTDDRRPTTDDRPARTRPP